jgi:quinol monooxygenase YgiN
MYLEAMEFVLKDCREVLPDVPILALYLPQNLDVLERGRRIIGHSTKLDFIGTLEIALKLVPGAKRVYVVSGAHELDRKIKDLARGDWKKWEGRLEFHYLSHMALEDILTTVSNVPRDSIILALTFAKDVAGKSQTTPALARRLSEVSTAPIFGILDVMLGHGITGGSLISFEHIGTKTGQLTLDTLRGTKTTDDIPAVFVCEQVWKNQDDLDRYLRSEDYRHILLLMELAAEAPEIKFQTISETAGIEVVEKARGCTRNGDV